MGSLQRRWFRSPGTGTLAVLSSGFGVLLSACVGYVHGTGNEAGAGGAAPAGTAGRGGGAGGTFAAGGVTGSGGTTAGSSAGGSGVGGSGVAGSGAGATGAGGSVAGRGGSSGRGGGSGTGGRTSSAGGTSGTSPTDGGSIGNPDASPTANDGPGIFVAVGYGGRRVRSMDDGATWVDDQALDPQGGDDNDLLRAVAWGNGQFVALGYKVMTSPDGKTWNTGSMLNQWVGAVVYAGSLYVAQGGYGMRISSPDGLTWTHHDIDETASHPADGLAYMPDMGGRLVAANDNGQRSYSTNGSTWTYSTGATSVETPHVAAGNGLAVAVTEYAQALVSTDGGATWSDPVQIPGDCCTGIVFAQGQFTGVGSGAAYTSVDGVNWVTHTASGKFNPYSVVVYGHGTYVVLAPGPLRSTDLKTWTAGSFSSSSNSSDDLEAIAFAPTGP